MDVEGGRPLDRQTEVGKKCLQAEENQGLRAAPGSRTPSWQTCSGWHPGQKRLSLKSAGVGGRSVRTATESWRPSTAEPQGVEALPALDRRVGSRASAGAKWGQCNQRIADCRSLEGKERAWLSGKEQGCVCSPRRTRASAVLPAHSQAPPSPGTLRIPNRDRISPTCPQNTPEEPP